MSVQTCGLQPLLAHAVPSRTHAGGSGLISHGALPSVSRELAEPDAPDGLIRFLVQRRIRRAEQLMADTTMTIMEIALTVGFQTQAHFTTVFKRFSGCTPRHWRVSNHMYPRPSPNPQPRDSGEGPPLLHFAD